MGTADVDCIVQVSSQASISTEKLYPIQEEPSCACESQADSVERRRCGCLLLLVPACSLLLTAALATLTAGALLAASCTINAQYEVPCADVRLAILESSKSSALLASWGLSGAAEPAFQVVSQDKSHVKLIHDSPKTGARYHMYFLFETVEKGRCSCQALASSSRWFKPYDDGEGYCAIRYLAALSGDQQDRVAFSNTTDSGCSQYSESTCSNL